MTIGKMCSKSLAFMEIKKKKTTIGNLGNVIWKQIDKNLKDLSIPSAAKHVDQQELQYTTCESENIYYSIRKQALVKWTEDSDIPYKNTYPR